MMNIQLERHYYGKYEDNMILFRGKHSFVCMNLYPYNNGHLLVVPNEIVDKPEELGEEVLLEIMKEASQGKIKC